MGSIGLNVSPTCPRRASYSMRQQHMTLHMIWMVLQNLFLILSQDWSAAGQQTTIPTTAKPCQIENVDVQHGCKFLLIPNEEPVEGTCDIENVDVEEGCLFFLMLDVNGCNATTILCEIKMLSTEIRNCSPPVRIDELTILAPKTQCNDGKSAKSVFGQNCTVNGGLSSCMMGGNGFSFCDVEFLFYRDGHWVDWDLCSLCTVKDKDRPLTSRGYLCEGECNNLWNNGEMEAPRCKVKDRDVVKDPEYDYCTTCHGVGCPTNVQVDNRPGSQVKRLGVGIGK